MVQDICYWLNRPIINLYVIGGSYGYYHGVIHGEKLNKRLSPLSGHLLKVEGGPEGGMVV